MNKKIRPTIRDVATAAKVSTATVSKFINGAQRFSPAVETMITTVINELGYRTNPLARSMVTGKTKTIGLSVLDVSNPHFSSFVKGANRVAIVQGYTVLLVDTDENTSRERVLLEALSQRADGMIIFSRLPEQELGWLTQLEKPVIYFGRSKHLQFPSVRSDDQRGAYMLAQHLTTLGHKKIAYLGFAKSAQNEERMIGIKKCLDAHQLGLNLYNCNSPTALEGERMCSSIMLGSEHPDALICYNDLIALGFMKEAQALGFKLPADISVAGFDNIEYGRYTFPALTSVDLQSEQMGIVAMENVLAAIKGDAITDFTVIEPRLILRASTIKRN